MPQPFEQFSMDQLGSFSKEMFRNEARKINIPIQHGDLAHYLVNNFKSELSSDEHVVDTAIRLLKNKISSQPDSGEQLSAGRWHRVEDRPLVIRNAGAWICTNDGCTDFIAAVPYNDKRQPGKSLWWIRHCVIEDVVGLCVIGDDENEPAGWEIMDITHWTEFIKTKPDESQPEDTHIMLNRLQEYGNRGRALGFAEWCSDNNYIYMSEGLWHHDAGEHYAARISSEQLYNLYIQSENKPSVDSLRVEQAKELHKKVAQQEIERLKGLIKAVQLSATDVRHEGILISYVSYNNLISQQQG